MESAQPPESPPLTSYAVTESSIDVSDPRTAFTYLFDTNTEISGGIESNPHAGIIIASVLDAIKSYLECSTVQFLHFIVSSGQAGGASKHAPRHNIGNEVLFRCDVDVMNPAPRTRPDRMNSEILSSRWGRNQRDKSHLTTCSPNFQFEGLMALMTTFT